MEKKILIILACVSALPVRGQITLPDLVHQALANNPGLALGQADSLNAAEEVTQARASRLPSLDFSGSYRRQSTVPEIKIAPVTLPFGAGIYSPIPGGAMQMGTLDNFDFRLTVAQPLFTGFRLAQKVAASRANQDGKAADLRRQRCELIGQVEKAYGQVLKTLKYVDIARTSRDQVAAHVRDVKKMVDQGILKREEVLKTDVRLSEAELAIVQAENGLAMSRSVLENLLAKKLPTDAPFSAMPTPDAFDLNKETTLETAWANRAELQTLHSAQQASRSVTRMAKGGRLPNLAAFGSVGYGKPGLDMLKKEWMDYWLVGVGMEWNIWNWGKTRSQIQQTEIKQRALAHTERQLRDAIELDVTQALLQVQEAMQRRDLCVTLTSQAEESFRVAEKQYLQGMATHTEYFDAQSALTRARLGQAQADIDYNLALANLRRAQGVNDKPYVTH